MIANYINYVRQKKPTAMVLATDVVWCERKKGSVLCRPTLDESTAATAFCDPPIVGQSLCESV